MKQYFRVERRNPHHWDIVCDEGRIFAIRGVPGQIFIRDERPDSTMAHGHFTNIETAMAFISGLIMHEPLTRS